MTVTDKLHGSTACAKKNSAPASFLSFHSVPFLAIIVGIVALGSAEIQNKSNWRVLFIIINYFVIEWLTIRHVCIYLV